MFATYIVFDVANSSDIIDDIGKILTGTTDPNLLSSNCNKGSSTIRTDYSNAGWTMHDDTPGGDSIVVKSLHTGSTTQYKYAKITLSAGYLLMLGYETWDNVTHSGTNQTSTSYVHSTGCRPFLGSDGNSGNLFIYADSMCLAIQTQDSSGGWGSGGNYLYDGFQILAEYNRTLPWNIVDVYPSFAVLSTAALFATYSNYYTYAISPVRIKDKDRNDQTQKLMRGLVRGLTGTYIASIPSGEGSKIPNNNDEMLIPMWDVIIYSEGSNPSFVDFGDFSNCHFRIIPKNLLTDLQIFNLNGTNYIALRACRNGTYIFHIAFRYG